MKIALAQNNYIIGDFAGNTSRIIASIHQAREAGARLVVFSELAVCGYPPRDFLEFEDFIHRCEDSVQRIADACRGIAAVVGSPVRNTSGTGKPLYNAALFLQDGAIRGIQRKSLLPNYDIFDEYRYFEPNSEFAAIDYEGERIALSICEDLWNTGDHPLYVSNPLNELQKHQPTLLINLAASPFHSRQAEVRTEVLRGAARQAAIPLLYVNQVGGQTELLFDGGSLAMDATGRIGLQMAFFGEDMAIVDTEILKTGGSGPAVQQPERISLIHDALVMGIREYFGKLGFSKAVLGLSGGIDSAVVLVLAARALGPENVLGVLMPSRYSSPHSITDARQLAENLGAPYEIHSIESAVLSFESLLGKRFAGLPPDLTEENIQARVRAVILMALSNKFGYILLNTSNKSEAAVGYGTLYGDMCGGLSVLGDVYKTEVYELAQYINRGREIIPLSSILKPPSAELRPGQKDSDSLPDYAVLDEILYQYIELRKGPREIQAAGFDAALVDRVLKLVNFSEYKRQQTPPILRISHKAFGSGRRMPVVGRYLY